MLKTYAAYTANEVRDVSSSGGIFSILAKKFDFVYGVAMSEDNYSAEFIRCNSNDISRLRGSKYLQAKVGDTYVNVKKDLDDGKRVLFSGTICQVNGLKMFLRKEYENLITIDVICHGVPSPLLWETYLKEYERLNNIKVNNVLFRSKQNGWENYGMMLNNRFYRREDISYFDFFLRDWSLRESCYSCKAKKNKLSDITLGDFWGIQNVRSHMNDDKVISVVIIRNEKGQKIFDEVHNELFLEEVTYEEGIKSNPSEYKSVRRPKERNDFYKDFSKMNLNDLRKKYLKRIKVPFYKKIIFKMRAIVKKQIGRK